MHLGIDLGTTNSAIAVFDGLRVSIVPNSLGEVLTPSVVRLDARGGVSVGRRAARFLETDPANTRGEFKRLMGSQERLEFEAARKSLLPEELSAHVLASLLADARDVLGYPPRSAVISTPALFELPQNHATADAGRRAGLAEVVLIQEPIASAIAAGWAVETQGLWLVIDLGGGTLDVSLLETKDNWLRVVDHAGDNFLGGKDFDNVLVDWSVERLKEQHGLPDLARSNPARRRAIAKLKAACEQAKIDLSRLEAARIVVPELCEDASGKPVEVDLEVERGVFEGLVEPFLERSLSVCRSLLERHHATGAALEKVVFVGGPTLMPALRARIGDALGGRVAEGIDPMTIVARGAALYAATARLDARPASAPATGGLPVQLEHPAVTSDLHPFVVGRFLPPSGTPPPRRVRVERDDRGFVSADVEVGPEGGLVVQVDLERQRKNVFRLAAFDAEGREVPVRGAEFAIVQGVSVADPPLSRAVGVARSDDTVHVYFEKGTPLPARRSFVHRTIAAVTAGGREDVLRIPVVQGEYQRAHLNRLVGALQIEGPALTRDLPAGTAVEVTLHLDRSGQLKARADLPSTGLVFENVAHLLVPTASLEVLALELAAAEQRVTEIRRRAFESGVSSAVARLEGAAALVREARNGVQAAQGGDRDAAQRAHRLLLDLNAALDDALGDVRWPELEREANRVVELELSWVGAWGTAAEQKLFDEALTAISDARKRRDSLELERQLKVIRSLGHAAFSRDPRADGLTFDWYAARLSEATDLPRAQTLVERGREARRSGDGRALRSINVELAELFPGRAEDRIRSFGSGVQ